MKSIDKWGISAAFMVLMLAFSIYLYQISTLKHLDSVFLFESVQSILESGKPASKTIVSWSVVLPTLGSPIESDCPAQLAVDEAQVYNPLDNHAYFALYPIAVLTAFVGPEIAFAILNALAHVLLLIMPFIFLRKQKAGLLSSLIFVLCVALYPVWSYSNLGDYYLDRLYMPFALLSLYCMHTFADGKEGKPNRRLLIGFVLSTIFAAICTERAAIMMMGAIVYFLVFFPGVRKNTQIRNIMLALLVFLGAYIFVYIKFIFEGLAMAGGSLQMMLVTFLSNPLDRLVAPGLTQFALVNLLFLGIFVLFSGLRYFALAVGTMMPNLFFNIGGAELNGWTTHYHAMYLPFMVFTGSIGYLKLVNRFNVRSWRFSFPLVVGVFVVLVAGFLNPFSGKWEDNFLANIKSGGLAKVYSFSIDPAHSGERILVDKIKSLDGLIPPGTKVSVIEGAMAVLYKTRHLSIYPVNINRADYLVILGSVSGERATSVGGAISYAGQLHAERLNQCLWEKVIQKDFELVSDMPAIGALIFRRNQ